LEVSAAKTEVQCIGKQRKNIKITLGANQLIQTEDFIYLGDVISEDVSWETLKTQDWKTWDQIAGVGKTGLETRDQSAWVEIAGLENVGPNRKG